MNVFVVKQSGHFPQYHDWHKYSKLNENMQNSLNLRTEHQY